MQYLEAVQRGRHRRRRRGGQAARGPEFDDVFARNGKIRAEDHRVLHDAYLAQVKPKAEVTGALGLREDPQDHPGGRGVPAAPTRRAAASC